MDIEHVQGFAPIKDLADYLGKSERTIWRYVRRENITTSTHEGRTEAWVPSVLRAARATRLGRPEGTARPRIHA